MVNSCRDIVVWQPPSIDLVAESMWHIENSEYIEEWAQPQAVWFVPLDFWYTTPATPILPICYIPNYNWVIEIHVPEITFDVGAVSSGVVSGG